MQKLTQAAAFAHIRGLGLIVRKTEYGDFRVADASEADLAKREAGAAYCSDLQEAIDTAEAWAANKADVARVAAEAEAKAEALRAESPRVIDATPTWAGVLPMLCLALENATEDGKRIARAELQRMAEAADRFNAYAKGRANA